MPGIISALRDAANPFSILTKGTLILRDLELLRQAAEVTSVGVSFSVGFLDDETWRSVEPGTPSPRARLAACRTLTDSGITCGILMAPILPYLTDSAEALESCVRAIAEAGATRVSPIVLHLRPGAREWYFAWLERKHPELVSRYKSLYGRGAYAPTAYQKRISDEVNALAVRYGLNRAGRPVADPLPAGTDPQLALL
jgi:DNA repair photolyase